MSRKDILFIKKKIMYSKRTRFVINWADWSQKASEVKGFIKVTETLRKKHEKNPKENPIFFFFF
jgi:hypothetical protein